MTLLVANKFGLYVDRSLYTVQPLIGSAALPAKVKKLQEVKIDKISFAYAYCGSIYFNLYDHLKKIFTDAFKKTYDEKVSPENFIDYISSEDTLLMCESLDGIILIYCNGTLMELQGFGDKNEKLIFRYMTKSEVSEEESDDTMTFVVHPHRFSNFVKYLYDKYGGATNNKEAMKKVYRELSKYHDVSSDFDVHKYKEKM